MVFYLIAMVTPFMSIDANVSTVYVFLLPLAFLFLKRETCSRLVENRFLYKGISVLL